jgi:thiol-disulfide isomerase/thioredoxin
MAVNPEIETYNYTDFVGSDFLPFRTILPVGSKALDFKATLLETGESVQLSEYWRSKDVLLEFGSLTWPYCALAAPELEPMSKELSGKGISFIFVYVREAHPGENFPAHRSLEQKLAHARSFREQFRIERPILVDDLAGTGHKMYGMLPNMTYLIGRGGKVLFRADWTDPPTIRNALDYVLASRARRREGLRLAPFYAEFVGYRWSDISAVEQGLARAGKKAVEDFKRANERFKKQGPRPGKIKLEE